MGSKLLGCLLGLAGNKEITAILMMLHGGVSMCSSDMLSRFFNLQVFLLQANVSDQDRTRELTVLKCATGSGNGGWWWVSVWLTTGNEVQLHFSLLIMPSCFPA